MNRILVIMAILLASVSVFAQKGTIDYLNEKRGFKTLILGSPISNYSEMVKQVPGKTNQYTVIDSTMYHIGDDIELIQIEVTTLDGKIRTIGGVAKKAYGKKLFDVFTSAYGFAFSQPNRFTAKYTWLTDKVSLFFNNDDTKWCAFIFKDLELDNLKAESDKSKTQKAADDI